MEPTARLSAPKVSERLCAIISSLENFNVLSYLSHFFTYFRVIFYSVINTMS